MFQWERLVCRNPSLKPCWTISDRIRIALSKSSLDNFWALLKKGVNINQRDQLDKTPLHLVIEWKKDFGVVQAVLSAGADPNAIDCQGHTPLHAAIYSYSSPAIIKALLNAGADIEIPDSLGRSPLMMSIHQKSSTSILQTLLSAGANIKLKNIMVEAVKAKTDPEVISRLITAGVSVNNTSTALSPLSYAVKNDDLKVVKLLLAAGARIDFLHYDAQSTLLHIVKGAGVAEELIKYGMDVNAVNNLGETPLHIAVFRDFLDVATTLIKAGADVHRLVGSAKDNCLHLAQSKPMVNMLVSHGVDINARNWDGSTPLLVLLGFCNILRLDNCITPKRKSYYEKKKKYISAIMEMLKCGADVNAFDENGICILELAVKFGSTKVMSCLMKYGT